MEELPEEGLGSLEAPVGAGAIGGTNLATHDGGKKLWKHRTFHVTLPDGKFTIREVNTVAGAARSQADAFVEAFESTKAAAS